MKRRATHPSRKKEPLLNAIDLDFTINKTQGFGLVDFSDAKTKLNLLEKIDATPDSDALFFEMIKDNEEEQLGRVIKASIARGDYPSIVTFNMSVPFTKFCLALLGLSRDEIEEKVFIRVREGQKPENKNSYIEDAKAHFRGVHGIGSDEPFHVVLLDDDRKNISAAIEMGYKAISAATHKIEPSSNGGFRISYPYLDDYQKALSISEEEMTAVRMPRMSARVALAKKLMGDKKKLKAALEMETASLSSALGSSTSISMMGGAVEANTAAVSFVSALQLPLNTIVDEFAAAQALMCLSMSSEEREQQQRFPSGFKQL